MTRSSSWPVYFFSFLLAFCSLFYELAYAQVLSVCLGGTKNQYLLTISIFTCALGFGSLLHGRLKGRYTVERMLFFIECLLMLVGALGPFLITWLLRPASGEVSSLGVLLSYGLIGLIGVLSGFELPCLLSMLENVQGKILAYDYLGMLVASVAFPLFIMPVLGTAASTLMVAVLNGSALVWLRSGRLRPALQIGCYVLILVLLSCLAMERASLNRLLSQLYMG